MNLESTTHPITTLLEWLPQLDFAVLSHQFLPYGRDYSITIQDCHGSNPGEHELIFTHCVRADYESRVGGATLRMSWDDIFCDYQQWENTGQPDGFVWGVNWSDAYPGLKAVVPSLLADEWISQVGHPFYEMTLETNQFLLRLVFHSIRHRKLSPNTETISAVTIPVR